MASPIHAEEQGAAKSKVDKKSRISIELPWKIPNASDHGWTWHDASS